MGRRASCSPCNLLLERAPMDVSKPMMPLEEAEAELPIDVEIGDESGVDVEIVPDPEPPAHAANLADYLEDEELTKIANDLIEGLDADESSRSDWLRQYTDGIDYLGFST